MIPWEWLFAAVALGSSLTLVVQEVWKRHLRKGVIPRPGRYLVRWTHPDGGQRQIYAGSDLKQAKYQFYQGSVRVGATMEFWDGPNCRGTR